MAKEKKTTSWRISDVSDEARKIARTSARAEKQTIGQWLSEIILSAIHEQDSVQAESRDAESDAPASPDMGDFEARLVRSLDRSQARSTASIDALQDTLSRLDQRLQDIEKRRKSG